MENIRIETNLRKEQDIPILDVTGEIDIYTTPQFKEAVAAAIDSGGSNVLINMSNVSYMDSSGFGTLLSATKRLRPLQGGLYLAGCNDSLTRMLQITRLNTVFGVYANEAEAVAAIQEATTKSAQTSPVV